MFAAQGSCLRLDSQWVGSSIGKGREEISHRLNLPGDLPDGIGPPLHTPTNDELLNCPYLQFNT